MPSTTYPASTTSGRHRHFNHKVYPMPETDNIFNGKAKLFPSEDLIRIIAQYLDDSGLEQASSTLQEESKIPIESPIAIIFRKAILSGEYEKAQELLLEIYPNMPENINDQIMLEMEIQRYLELLEGNRSGEALSCLQKGITPRCSSDASVVKKLASLITIKDVELMRGEAKWLGSGRQSREILLKRISSLLSVGILLPPRRLEQLLEQAMSYQAASCPAHFSNNGSRIPHDGLLQDHICDDSMLDFKVLHKLTIHRDEVHFIAFSHSGELLAGASTDHHVSIHSVTDGTVVSMFKEHAAPVTHLAWSPDDTKLLTCSNDSRARLWDVETGECIRIFLMGERPIVGVWTLDGSNIIIASQDGTLNRYPVEALTSDTLCLNRICLDLKTLPCGAIACLDHQHRINILDSVTLQSKNSPIHDESQVTCMAVSKDGVKCILNTINPPEILLYNLQTREHENTFKGHTNSKFIIRSTFILSDDSLIACGSEDGSIHLYHQENGNNVKTLKGHDKTVNCVTWSDKSNMMASCSDDHTIILWSSK